MSKKTAARRPRSAARTAPAPAAPRAKNYLPFVIIAAALVVALGVSAWLLVARRAPHRTDAAVAAGLPGARPPHTQGPASAPLTLEEFGDYQCPPCGQVYPELEKLRADYGDKLQLVFRHFPLPAAHKNALMAAHAAEAAGLQGKFWELHDQLYRHQREWADAPDPRAIFAGYARALGLDGARFERDMGGTEADARVVADHDRGRSLGVTGTPTLFLNGREVPAEASASQAELHKLLDATLSGRQP